MRTIFCVVIGVFIGMPLGSLCNAQDNPSAKQLERWLKRFPAADSNQDGKLSIDEAKAFRDKMLGGGSSTAERSQGAPRQFAVDPGWDLDRFPEHAVCYRAPDEIKAIYEKSLSGKQPAVVSYQKPDDGVLRIVGTGHSFMAPGYRTFPAICEARDSNNRFTRTPAAA